MDKKHFFALDSFRGLCALCVVIFHMKILNGFSEINFFRNSRLFVEFFFILSGFVLTHSHFKKDSNRFYNYAVARTFRIFPLHLFMLFIYIVLECFKLVAQHKGFVFNTLPFQGGNSIKELLPNLLLIQSWFSHFDYLSFNYPSWSISVEYYLYFIFFLVISPRLKNARILSGCAFFLFFVLQEYPPLSIFTGEVVRGGICFGAGVLAYFLFSLINVNDEKKSVFVIFSMLEIFSLIFIWYVVSYCYNENEFLIVSVFAFSVCLFAFEFGVISNLLRRNVFQFLGRLSYSIYLTHASILFVVISILMVLQKSTGIMFTKNIDGLRYLDTGHVVLNNILIILVLMCVILVSMFTYKFIEMPGQEIGRKLRHHNSKSPRLN